MPLMDGWKSDRIASAERGENPTVLARMRSGFAVIGDDQFLPGYCLLLAAPQVTHLSELPLERRAEFLLDMSLLGEAVEAVCRPRRINYEILGNTDPFVHAHVWPRYDWEPAAHVGLPVASYPREQRHDPRHALTEEAHGDLKRRLAAALLDVMARHGLTPS